MTRAPDPRLKDCPHCNARIGASILACPVCGHHFRVPLVNNQKQAFGMRITDPLRFRRALAIILCVMICLVAIGMFTRSRTQPSIRLVYMPDYSPADPRYSQLYEVYATYPDGRLRNFAISFRPFDHIGYVPAGDDNATPLLEVLNCSDAEDAAQKYLGMSQWGLKDVRRRAPDAPWYYGSCALYAG